MARYTFEGRLRGSICRDCRDHVADAQVLLYRHRGDQQVDQLVVERSKRTFAQLSREAVEAKADFLIAEATTAGDGTFRFELGDDQEYDGGPLEVDLRLSSLHGARPAGQDGPLQFTLTSLQPDWQNAGDGQLARWDHAIASRFWCRLLSLFGIWVICGRVVAKGTGTGLEGMTVRAFDRDWLQDDKLGEDVTDNTGRFRIYYTKDDFEKTPFSPFIDLELTSGPDVYFEVEDSGGNLVLDEQPSEGRQPGRENVGHCFCETLEVGEETPPYDDPWFTHVGEFHILWDIDPATGRTRWEKNGAGGVGWGFHGHTKLEGFCPKTHPTSGDPMFYRFKYVDPVTSAEKPVTGDMLRKVQVGAKLVWWDPDADGTFGWTTQSIHVAGSGATAPVSGGTGPVPDHIVEPDADGWIAVDQDGLDNGFYGPLIRLRTEKIVPGGAPASSPAGTAVPAADQAEGAPVELIFETTTDKVSIDRQSMTATLLVNNWAEVRELDIQELQSGAAGACTGLTTDLTILYTVDHELIDAWKVTMSSGASGAGWSQPSGLPQGNTPRGGDGSHHEDISSNADWPPCSYSVHLGSRRALTDGENDDGWNTSTKTFCKI